MSKWPTIENIATLAAVVGLSFVIGAWSLVVLINLNSPQSAKR